MSKTIKDQFESLGIRQSRSFPPVPTWKSVDDGVTHINITRFAKTSLGKLLAMNTRADFRHPYLGPFHTLEGFRRYILAPSPDENLRYMDAADLHVTSETSSRLDRKYYRALVLDGFYLKIRQNPELFKLFYDNTLPFAEYTVMPQSGIVVPLETWHWRTEGLATLQLSIQSNVDDYTLVTYEQFCELKNAAPVSKPTPNGDKRTSRPNRHKPYRHKPSPVDSGSESDQPTMSPEPPEPLPSNLA